MTDLPYGRGGSPLQNLITRKHSYTYLTCFRMIEELDSGPYYIKRKMSLSGSAQQIYVRSSKLSWKMIETFINSDLIPIEQKGKVTHFKRRNSSQSKINSKMNINDLYDFIRMLDADGYPNAFIKLGSKKIYLSKARFKNNEIIFKGLVKND